MASIFQRGKQGIWWIKYYVDAVRKTRKDQCETLRTYTYDDRTRLTADTVTTLGTDVDGSIRRIGRSYDDLGRKASVTSYSNTSGTTAVNEVAYTFDGLGNVTKSEQEHDGAVDGNTISVEYVYDDTVSGSRLTNASRLIRTDYPDTRKIHRTFGADGGIDDALSRVAAIKNDNGSGDPGTATYAAYSYAGAATLVEEDHPQVTGGLKLTRLSCVFTKLSFVFRLLYRTLCAALVQLDRQRINLLARYSRMPAEQSGRGFRMSHHLSRHQAHPVARAFASPHSMASCGSAFLNRTFLPLNDRTTV